MSRHGYSAYVVRPIVRVGRPARASQSGCQQPRALDATGHDELKQAAPLTPTDLAAILSGRFPFDPEPNDDLSIVEDWTRILARINEAIARGELTATPTLSEGITWARQVGLPIIGVGLEGVEAVGRGTKHSPPAHQRVSDIDPKLQKYAVEEGRRLLEQHGKAPKKSVASNIKKAQRLPQSVPSLMRRIRNTWSSDCLEPEV